MHRPTPTELRDWIDRQAGASFSYESVGCTRGEAPRGYFVDHYRQCLGTGERTYKAACDALRNWQMFSLAWIEVYPPAAPVAVGQTVAVLARAYGLWWRAACRIVYVDAAVIRRFGFAYGTLDAHPERGEERFEVTWNDDDRVWFGITAISQPARWWVWMFLPLARRLQRRFGADAGQAMLRACRQPKNK
ncbi:MAG: DUF1990 domain-containing protein [Planctomycetia bacterium]|nr:DUF1990 domain-containing protein [Planctomycetia bacterium]